MNKIEKHNKFEAVAMYCLSRVIYPFAIPFILIWRTCSRIIQDVKYKKKIYDLDRRIAEDEAIALKEAKAKDRIVTRGKATRFWKNCTGCNAQFTYGEVSVYKIHTIDARVPCPECGYWNIHDSWRNLRED